MFFCQRPFKAVNPSASGLGLADFIYNVKSELVKAEKRRIAAGDPRFLELKSAQVEVNFVVRAGAKAGGKVDYKVVSVEDSLENSAERVQKLSLTFNIAKGTQGAHP